MSWKGRTETNRSDVTSGGQEPLETPAERVKRVLREQVGNDAIMRVTFHKVMQEPTYEISASLKHPTAEPDSLAVVKGLEDKGLVKDKDFRVHQPKTDGYPTACVVVVKKEALERAVSGEVDRSSIAQALGIRDHHVTAVKAIPGGLNGAYQIQTSRKIPGIDPYSCKLSGHLQALGLQAGENFRAEAEDDKGVIITVRQAALEDKIPETRIPSRSVT